VIGDQFEARVRCIGTHALIPGRPYLLRIQNHETTATITEIKFKEDHATGVHLAAKTLASQETGVVNVSTHGPITFDPSSANPSMASFVLLDATSLETVGEGTIAFALRRASNIQWQALDIHKAERAAQMRQVPCCIWFTGLSGAGKSTIASLLEKRLHAAGRHTYLLDGDNVRHGLNRDLGFTEVDRVENIRRVAEVARLMVDAGLIVLVAFISPFRAERRMARGLFEQAEFIEVFVDAPLVECEKRDPKGLYAKARRGEVKNFTGIDSDYEPPQSCEIHLRTAELAPEECVEQILRSLKNP
jgi:bifunctional enzyme CysN/CysC